MSIRRLLRRPVSTAAIVGSLALGIGAVSSAYAVFNHVLLRPIPGVADPDSLLSVTFEDPNGAAFGFGERSALPDLRAAAASIGITQLAEGCCNAELGVSNSAGGPGTVERAVFVSSQYFQVLGIRTAAGRLLTDDEADGPDRVAVISERLWKTKLERVSDPIGRSLQINGQPFTVVGITKGFRGWTTTPVGETDLWLPASARKSLTGAGWPLGPLVARNSTHVDPAVLEARLRSAYERASFSGRARAFVPKVRAGLWPANGRNDRAMQVYAILMGAVGLVMAIACVNAAQLLLLVAQKSARETAVKRALGASRSTLYLELLTETAALSMAACVTGLVVAKVLLSTLRDSRILPQLPELTDVQLDGRVLGLTMGLAVSTAFATALLPATVLSRLDVWRLLVESGRSLAARKRFRTPLIAAQSAIAVACVAGAITLGYSLQDVMHRHADLRSDTVLQASIRPEDLGIDRTVAAGILRDVSDAINTKGRDKAAVSYGEPLDDGRGALGVRFAPDAQFQRKTVGQFAVSPNFFEVLNIRIIEGRTFTAADYWKTDPRGVVPVVLDSKLARDLFGSGSTVGRIFEIERSGGMARLVSPVVVVGVVEEISTINPTRESPGRLYHAQPSLLPYGTLLVRFSDSPRSAIDRLEATLREISPGLPTRRLDLLSDVIGRGLSEEIILARVSTFAAIVTTFLTCLGVVALLSQVVDERKREFAVRSAIGAPRGRIIAGVVQLVWKAAAFGVAMGLLLYYTASQWLAGHVFGVRAFDISVVLLASAALLLAAFAAALVPAWQTASLDPAVVLRTDDGS